MKWIRKAAFYFLLFVLGVIPAAINAQTITHSDSQAVIQQLKAENEALKKELQLLRQLLAS